MQTLTTQAAISPDGVLHLHLPCGLPPGPVEVVVVVQPVSALSEPLPQDPLCGTWADKLPDIDVDEALREMNEQWKRSIETSLE
jgi:hypothetical protein